MAVYGLVFLVFTATVMVSVIDAEDHRDTQYTGYWQGDNTREFRRIAASFKHIRNDITRLREENQALQTELAEVKVKAEKDTTELQIQNKLLWDEMLEDRSAPEVDDHNSTAGVYTRWGRNVCAGDATTLYSGIASGSTEMACLPLQPEWGNYSEGVDSQMPTMSGAQYAGIADSIFSPVNIAPETTFVYQDVPCTVCEVPRTSVLMIPARVSCPSGWRREYWGYLMGRTMSADGVGHVCVDNAPQAGYTGASNEASIELYNMEASCGALDCPNYVQGFELACVVCTK